MPANTSIEIKEGTVSISPSAFEGCSGLTSITIPESVTSIDDYAFEGCSSLRKVINLSGLDIRKGSSSHGYVAYYAEKVITADDAIDKYCFRTSEESTHYLIAYYGNDSILNLPEDYHGDDYIIDAEAFADDTRIVSVNIPQTVGKIGSSAFARCSKLASVTIPRGVMSIEIYAFEDCINLFEVINFSDLDIKKGYSSHGNVAYYAKKVVKVDDQIGDYYFYTAEDNTHYLQHYIGKDTVIVLPEDCNGDDYQIGETAFLNNDSITSVEIPQTVGTIGKSAFASCDNLAAVSLARGVMTIEDNAFENCVSLTSIVIPLNMTTIGNSAFAGCSSLASAEFKEGIDTIGNNAFENCTSLTALSFPESLTAIGEKAFSGCSALSSLSCSANIETYGEGAFEGCTAVETLTVMGSVMPTVPSDKLISITLFSPMPLETTEFANKVYRNATVYVPEGSLERYQAADVWKNFWTIKEFDSTGIEDVTMDVSDAPIYNMKGERMACSRKELQKGIYIQNGKKFVMK